MTVFVGDVGTSIELETGTDLRNATSLQIEVTKPSGVKVSWPAQVHPDNPTVMRYITQSGDIDEAGTWRLRAKVTMTGWSGSGTLTTMRVYNA